MKEFISDCNRIQTHNHLVRKRTLKWSNWLQTKWLWVRIRCSHLYFRYRGPFEQGFQWQSGNYRV